MEYNLNEAMYNLVRDSVRSKAILLACGALAVNRAIRLMKEEMPNYGAPGTRDIEVTRTRSAFSRALADLNNIETPTVYI
jgi:hypothetical protein